MTTDQQFQLTITTQGRLTEVGQFENIIVRANPDGSVVRVKDVARVDLGAQIADVSSFYNGAPSAAIQIYQAPGANAVAGRGCGARPAQAAGRALSRRI